MYVTELVSFILLRVTLAWTCLEINFTQIYKKNSMQKIPPPFFIEPGTLSIITLNIYQRMVFAISFLKVNR
jgi:hypothetical protein